VEQHVVYKAAIKWSFGYSMYLLPAWGFVWGYTLLNLLSMAIIICAIQRLRTLLIFENRALVRFGVISYGTYVYHVPLLLLLSQLHVPRAVTFVLYCATTILVAELSFRYLETPFLNKKNYWMSSHGARPAIADSDSRT
jgi:peptidoglycan/LPS O-acetylase OafA/YrhL